MKNWRLKMTAERKSLTDLKIQRDIFQGDALSSLLFVIKKICNSITHLRNAQAATNLLNRNKKFNHLMCMDEIKQFAKSKKRPGD